jgi:hypothetical protein
LAPAGFAATFADLPVKGHHDATERADHNGMGPLRSSLLLLTRRRRSSGTAPLLHYAVEESSARAIELCSQSRLERRIASMRDVNHQATAA